jgi:probable HAF family extracellular repeat protein
MYRSARSCLLLISLVSLTAALQAQETYRLERIAPHPDNEAADIGVADMNHRGEVVGAMLMPNGNVRAYVWSRGVMTDLIDLEGGASGYVEALGINKRSTIVGVTVSSAAGFRFRPFIREDGEMRDLGTFPDADFVFALGINDRGAIIGDFDGGAFVKDGDVVTVLDSLPGATIPPLANEISKDGVIVGRSDSAEGRRAVIWERGVIRNLGVLEGASASTGAAINGLGQVVGTLTYPGTSRGFVWTDGVMQALSGLQPSAWHVSANDINDLGQIVGSAISRLGMQPLALLWEEGVHFHILDELVDPNDALRPFVRIESASHINERGQIVTTGRDSRRPNRRLHYLMTPLDPDDVNDD